MKIIRITRISAIETALARADAWWAGLSRRERILVATMLTLIAAIVLIYGFVKPIQSARAQAIADIRTYETLNARIRAAGTLSTDAATQRLNGSPADIVSAAAQRAGITATSAPISGGVRASVAQADYDAVMQWIAAAAQGGGLSVGRVQIMRGNLPGQVSAEVDFLQ